MVNFWVKCPINFSALMDSVFSSLEKSYISKMAFSNGSLLYQFVIGHHKIRHRNHSILCIVLRYYHNQSKSAIMVHHVHLTNKQGVISLLRFMWNC